MARQTAQARKDRFRLLVLEDRERVSRQLNDSVIQRLFAVGLTLQSLQPELTESTRPKLGGAISEINQISRYVRHTIFSFEGHESSFPGLLGAVESTIRPVATSLGLDPVVTGTGPDSQLVPGMVVANVLAVVYQLVRDAGRFSSLDLLEVDVSVVGDEVVLEVREQGLPPDAHGRHPAEAELVWRAEEFGGSFEVTPRERGTALTWTVPMNPGLAAGSGPTAGEVFDREA